MILVNESVLDLISERNMTLARNYLKSGSLSSIEVHEAAQDQLYRVNALVSVSSYENDVSFTFDYQNQRYFDTYCACPWHIDDERICAHIAMVLLYLTKIDIQQFPYQSRRKETTSRPVSPKPFDYEDYYRQMRRKSDYEHSRTFLKRCRSERENLVRMELQNEKYDLFYSLEKGTGPFFLLGFSIGSDRKYIIKNLNDFLNNIRFQQYMAYGKQLAFVHHPDAFTDRAKELIDFIERTLKKQELYVYASFNRKRYLRIDGSNFDDFYNTFQQDQIFIEKDLKIPLRISDQDDAYRIHMPDEWIDSRFFTDKGIYRAGEKGIECFLFPKHSVLPVLCSELHSNDLWIEKKDYPEFEHTILIDNRQYLDLPDTIPALPALSHDCIYGDLKDNSVLFRAYARDNREHPLWFTNNLSFNEEIILSLLKDNATRTDEETGTFYFDLDFEDTYQFLDQGVVQLQKYCDVYISDALKRLKVKKPSRIQAGVRINNNLLEIQLEAFDFDVAQIPDILAAYRKKKHFFKLKDGSVLSLQAESLNELNELLEDYQLKDSEIQDGTIRLGIYRSLNMDRRMEELSGIQVKKDQTLTSYVKGFTDRQSELPIDPHYQNILHDYQKTGVEWLLMLYRYGLNGILADEMGLGKTLQVIALLDSVKDENHHSLVVCPASLIYNWEDEVKRFSKTLTCLSVVGPKKRRKEAIKQAGQYDLLITSYDYLRNDMDMYEELSFTYVILDEAQNIKNQKTKNAKSVKHLQAEHRLALSGTPIENSLAELWSIFDFLMPGYLFSYSAFRNQYEGPIVLNQDETASRKLKSMVSPFILRRTKKEVLTELPDKVDHEYLIDFTPEEKKLYLSNLMLANRDVQDKVLGQKLDTVAVLQQLMRLRQLCCDPRLVYENWKEPSSKVQACCQLVNLLSEHHKKSLVFSSFTSLFDLLKVELDKSGISYYVLTGSTSKEERKRLVQAFQNDDTSVFLISLKAGGTGLNLTAAEAVIHVDPWWNISAQNQATDRAHRIGQNANVQVYRMIMKDSVEEKIEALQLQKKDLADSFVEGNDGSLARLSKEEILQLFER